MKRKTYKKIRLDELSTVDSPAQQGARMVIMKRLSNKEKPVSKMKPDAYIITNSDNTGHSHILYLSVGVGETSHERRTEDSEHYHTHPYTISPEGVITIGEADGHSHEIDQEQAIQILNQALEAEARGLLESKVNKFYKPKNEEGNMPNPEDSKIQKALDVANETLSKISKAFKSLISLDEKEFSFAKSLSEDERESFLSSPRSERAAIIKAAEDADPVVYTTTDGQEIRKSAGAAFVEMAKGRDEDRKLLNETLKSNQEVRYQKRASTEIPNLVGDESVKVTLLKSIDTITDVEEKEKVLQVLKAANDTYSTLFKRTGTTTDPVKIGDTVDPNIELETLTKKLMETDSKLTHAEAYETITKRNPELYAQAIQHTN